MELGVSQVERGEDKGKASRAEGTAHGKAGGEQKSMMLTVNHRSSLTGVRMSRRGEAEVSMEPSA